MWPKRGLGPAAGAGRGRQEPAPAARVHAAAKYKHRSKGWERDATDSRRPVRPRSRTTPGGHHREVLWARKSRRNVRLVPTRPANEMEGAAYASLPSGAGTMIRSLYIAARERRWNRDRRRRIAEMLQRERSMLTANVDWLEAMAIQLAEIRGLPEAVEPRR